jgi:hypothetical protein
MTAVRKHFSYGVSPRISSRARCRSLHGMLTDKLPANVLARGLRPLAEKAVSKERRRHERFLTRF